MMGDPLLTIDLAGWHGCLGKGSQGMFSCEKVAGKGGVGDCLGMKNHPHEPLPLGVLHGNSENNQEPRG